MALNREGMNPEKSFARQANQYSCRFTTSATAGTVAASLLQDEGVVASVARSAQGVYLLTLADRWARIIMGGAPNVSGTTALIVQATVVDGGAATNTITVRVKTDAGVASDSEGEKCDVNFRLITSARGI